MTELDKKFRTLASQVANYIWDADSDSWVPQTASGEGGGGGSGEVTVTNASLAVTQEGTWTVDFTDYPGITDTELRATPLPVSGTLTVNTGLTDTQLRATPIPVSGMFWQATQPVSGTFWQATQPVSIASMPSTPVTGTFWQATQPVSLAPVALTPASPASGSVGASSAQLVASNGSRKGLIVTNLSANTVSLGLAATAVLNSGITLTPYGSWQMDASTFVTGAVNAIASSASSAVAVQEFS